MRIGIDLLWIRPGICGGTESYTRNMLDGFALYDQKNEYILFVTEDNADSFRKYQDVRNMKLEICPTKYEKQSKRIMWENLHLDKRAKKCNIELMFIPVYSKPVSWRSKIPYVTVIHDLQGLHYPEYFSFSRLQFFKWCWRYACKSSKRVVVLSDYGKEDLIRNYPYAEGKTVRIYNPIISNHTEGVFEQVAEKYGLEAGKFFYCVSALLPHKNLNTLLKVMREWDGEEKLVLSGVGDQNSELGKLLEEYDLLDKVILTGFVSNEERDSLYEHCRLFLFPSVFEGFGMPPIEAMRRGKRVVMTDKTCLKEVTRGKGIYVEDPFSVEEWIDKMHYAMTLDEEVIPFEEYELKNAVQKYIRMFEETVN